MIEKKHTLAQSGILFRVPNYDGRRRRRDSLFIGARNEISVWNGFDGFDGVGCTLRAWNAACGV